MPSKFKLYGHPGKTGGLAYGGAPVFRVMIGQAAI